MRAYFAFTKKEYIQSVRTYKLVIMLAVFLLFGIMSPFFAKMMPQLLKSIGTNGIIITIPEPTAMDSWAQFFKNVGQMGMLVLVIVFSGMMANEFSSGTLINILTKGMKRYTVILSKLTMAMAIWTLSYMLSLAVCYGYTAYFWKNTGLYHVFSAFSSLWFFGLLLISLLILGGTLFKSISGSLLFTGGAVVIMSLLGMSPKLQKFNPLILSGDHTALLTGMKAPGDLLPALLICALLIVVLTIVSILVFNRKEI